MPKGKPTYYYRAQWEPGGVYHVYNSAVQPNRAFASEERYRFFVELLRDRLPGFATVFAYAIIPNHFHLALQLRPLGEFETWVRSKAKRTVKEEKWLRGELPYHQLVGDYFSVLFAIYATAFNASVGRRGTLLDRGVRRIRVRDDLLSRRLIMCIHTNEAKHGMLADYTQSGLRTSFAYYGMERDDHWLARDAVLVRFGGLEAFYRRHAGYVRKYGTQVGAFDEALYFDPVGKDAASLLVAPPHEFLEDVPPPQPAALHTA